MKNKSFSLLLSLSFASVSMSAESLPGTFPPLSHYDSVENQSDAAYRQRSFPAYLPLEEVSRRLKSGNYSSFENPTGIYFNKGDKISIDVLNKKIKDAKLIIHEFAEKSAHSEYPLKPGLNELTASNSGLAYIDYRSMHPEKAAPLRCKITGGRINGLFGLNDSNETWVKLLKNAKSEMIDLIGDRVQLVMQVDALRKHCPKDGVELLRLYDAIMTQQQGMMGLDNKHTAHPGNHIMGRNMWSGYMHADGMGAAFHHNTMAGVGNPEQLRKSSWGVAHEFGHVNQPRRGFCWVGMTEVSNNIFSLWSNYMLHPEWMRLEHEVIGTKDGAFRGGRLQNFLYSALILKQLWSYNAGDGKDAAEGADPFVSLVPLWQLQLYMADVVKNKDFWPLVFKSIYQTDEGDMTQGELRCDFFKKLCDASKLNLSEYLVRTRMLAPINRWTDDYGPRMLTITPEMVKDVLLYASKYPEPSSPVIFYACVNNIKYFADKTPIKPSPKVKLVVEQGKLIVPAGAWQGSVAFEVYDADNKLMRAILLGMGHEDNQTTTIPMPEGASSVKAVSWDGKRLDIYPQS